LKTFERRRRPAIGTAAGTAVLAGLIAGFGGVPASAQDVLPPDQVYLYEISAGEREILLDFEVLDGYYLYRDKFDFVVADPAVALGTPRFPRGEIHEDEFFGEQEIYRHDFEIAIPYTLKAAASDVELELRLQGCADIGLCYPPQRWPSVVAVPASAQPAAARPANRSGSGLAGSSFAGVDSNEPLPIDEAFVPNARFDSANELTIGWQIAPGYYLYRDKFSVESDGEVDFGAAVLPEGEPLTDQNFGEVEVYYDYVEIVVPFARAHPDEQFLAITAGFQGCKDESICYPPAEHVFEMTLPASNALPAAAASSSGAASGAAPPMLESEQDRYSRLILDSSWLAFLGTFYVAGLALSLTPCVLPMVPILSSIIAGQGEASTGRSFALSLSYVMGMAVTYTVAGAVAAMAGNQVQALFQTPWIIATFAGLFVVMALGMFGLFEIQMPNAIQSRLSQLANRQKGGTFYGTAIVGALTALIVTTCVAPPLIGALTVIGQSGDVTRGASALFTMSMGMGTPLLLVGASAGHVLPKVGPWMNTIKAAFGVIMIGMAIWMLDRILPGTVTLVLWALLVFLTGVFLGAFEPLPQDPQASRRLAKGVGVLACLYGAMMLIGAMLGGENPLKPLPQGGGFLAGQAEAHEEALDFVHVESVAQLETLLGQAQAAGQPVMIDFTAEWCVSCKEMEAYTFPDPAVIAALEPFMLLRADVTANDAEDQALLGYFDSFGPPTIAFFDRSGASLDPYKLVGYKKAEPFAEHVTAVAAL
jgi:thiol:disulfide interchange protein DsbD